MCEKELQTSTPSLKSIYYPVKRYGHGFEGVKSKLEQYAKEVRHGTDQRKDY